MLEKAAVEKTRTVNVRGVITSVLKGYGIYLAFLLFCIYLSFSTPHFLTIGNILTVTRQVAVTGILACGLTMILIQGDIDLSFGSLLTVVGIIVALLQGGRTIQGSIITLPLWIVFIVAAIVGIVLELVNSAVITKFSVNPFIVTLAAMTVLKGVALVISGGNSVTGLTESFSSISNTDILGIPLIFIAFLIIAAIIWFILKKTSLGRYVYSIGGNVQAAYLSGVAVSKARIMVFGIMGLMTSISAIVLTSRLKSATPLAGDPYLMDVIAACVIGGTSLSGGVGGIPGTVLGVFFLGIINNGLNLLGVPSAYQYIAKGLIIAIAVIIDANKVKVEGQYIK